MAPKRGICYKCEKFQTHIRRHVKTCKSQSPSKKRRIINVTSGNTLIGNDFNRESTVTDSNTSEWTVTARNKINANMITKIIREPMDGRPFDTSMPEEGPKVSILDMMRYGIKEATMMQEFRELNIVPK